MVLEIHLLRTHRPSTSDIFASQKAGHWSIAAGRSQLCLINQKPCHSPRVTRLRAKRRDRRLRGHSFEVPAPSVHRFRAEDRVWPVTTQHRLHCSLLSRVFSQISEAHRQCDNRWASRMPSALCSPRCALRVRKRLNEIASVDSSCFTRTYKI